MKDKNDPNFPPNFDPNFDPNFNPNFGPGSPYGQQPPFQQPPVGRPMSWQEVWTSAITEPNEQTYWNIIIDPLATTQRAILWIVSAFFVSMFLGLISNALVAPINESAFNNAFVRNNAVFTSQQPTNVFSTETQIGFLLCFIPIAIIVIIVIFAIVTGVFHIIARLMGGSGTYDQLFYAFAAFYAPLTIVSGIIGLIPVLGLCLGFFLMFFQIYLAALAIKTVHRFGWSEAIVTLIMPVSLYLGCIFCTFAAALSTL